MACISADFADFETRLRTEAAELGVCLCDAGFRALRVYGDMLLEFNEKFNLTAITAPDEVVTKHFADSLSLLPVKEKYQGKGPLRLIDVGAGAGFPGLALWIAGAGDVCLLDSVGKRFSFIRECVSAISAGFAPAGRLETAIMRAEDAGRLPAMRESFDAAAARAVAGMRILAELCLPLVKPGGFFYAMKGPSAENELRAAAGVIAELGGETAGCEKITLRGGLNRTIVAVAKTRATPEKYPRKYSVMKKI